MRALENPALRRWGAVSTLLPLLAEAWIAYQPLGHQVGHLIWGNGVVNWCYGRFSFLL